VINMDEYVEYMRGKSVALVGPADTCVGRCYGGYIDGHDVVCRLNMSYDMSDQSRWVDYGERMDVLYSALADKPSVALKHPVKYIVCPFPNEPPYRKQIKRERAALNNIVVATPKQLRAFEGHYHSRPLTGTLAIAHLLSLPISRLFITGMSVYRTDYYSGYSHLSHDKTCSVIQDAGNHVFANDEDATLRFLADPRIEPDWFLLDLYNSKKQGASDEQD